MKGWKWSNGETVTAAGRAVLDPHDAGRRPARTGATTSPAGSRQHHNVKATGPTTLTMTMNKAVQPDLVHLQRAEPDHPDADGLGHHRGRAPSELRCTAVGRLRQGLQLPRQPVQDLSSWAARRSGRSWTARGSWPASTPTATPRSCRTRPTPARPSRTLAKFQEVPFTTERAEYNVLQAGRGRRRRPEDRRRLPADHRRADQAGQRDRRHEPGQRLHARPAVSRGRSTTSRSTSSPPPATGRSSSSCTSGRRCST